MKNTLHSFGNYVLLLGRTFHKPSNFRVYHKNVMREFLDLGVNSIGLVAFLSLFMGAILAMQMFQNFESAAMPVPDAYVGYATKVVLILEFSPTIISIILAGKVGSYIASSMGTMRATEQIDALEVMGINAESFLILPKIVANLLFSPILLMISILMGILGGYWIGIITQDWSTVDFVTGIQMPFGTWFYIYSFIKMEVFAFIITTLPAYYGFHVKGGSLEVGLSSTKAVVWTCIIVIVLDLLLTHLLL